MTKKHQSQVGILICWMWAIDSATIFSQSVNNRVLPPLIYQPIKFSVNQSVYD